jgi:predicted nucleic-acid-binding Zn-ribbon protein
MTNLFGIEKQDFISAHYDGIEIFITYTEHYDIDGFNTKSFDSQISVDLNDKNVYLIKEVFGFDLNEGRDYTVKTVRLPENKAVVGRIDVETSLWFTCPKCGMTESYVVEGVRKRADIHYIITTECCNTRIELKGTE